MIRKKNNKRILFTSDGKHKLGEYNTKKEALKRERQIQYFKRHKKQQ